MNGASGTSRDVPWLGEVPTHWRVRPLWSMFRRIKDIGHPDEPMLSVFRDYGVVLKNSRENLNKTAENRNIYQLVHPGWLITNRMKAWQGSVGISPHRGIVSGHYLCFAPTHCEHTGFLNWLFRSSAYTASCKLLSRGVRPNQAEIDNDGYRQMPVILPPVDEQLRIADFLDHETAQIDALIAKQEQLIETLRERRQAVLDTEFEALGAKRVQLRREICFLTSGSRGWGDYYADQGERFLRIGNLPRTNLILRGGIQYVQLPPGVTEGSRTRLRRDDLVFSITAYLGSVAVVTDEWIGAYVSQHVALCRLDPSRFDSQFVGYFMLTTEGQDQLNLGAAGGTKIQLALDDIKALSVPLVPLGVQRKIVASIEVQLSKIDALVAKAEEFIGLARERRSALITEAVTGRIDVSTGKAREGA